MLQKAGSKIQVGLCRVLRERDLSPARLCEALRALAADAALRRKLEESDFAGGNRAIVEVIERAARR